MFSQHVVEIAARLGKSESLKDIETFLGEHDQFHIFQTSLSEELDGCTYELNSQGLNAYFRYQKCTFKKKREQMARAKRHYLPDHVWHIPHRCHKKEFLLKFAKQKQKIY